MDLLDGRSLSKKWRQELKTRVSQFKDSSGVQPCLAVVLVGEDPASQVYVSHKIKACAEAGILSVEKRLAERVARAVGKYPTTNDKLKYLRQLAALQ